ncbi:NAD-dependent epimerase/dehydratase family protein [Ruminiclostridium cellulolyticum]|uniref:NAD-dependent epimerase/dehydratase n=1 Tax=Ruminiclostridium cellulolyticum (strain ATCC 35319 / DSM 5812 / JCM 6584 / H10) TaxID=394503 RepID=B8I971_RUMCH|nr:NAD-dependent epimerase/dehydratase family protein [Ruminiclostridium cellulolyticum]ACL75331.1 NAD-dependent epimerase/dehydratase [Ruminiclostridium cellulolyticum H10]
MKVLVTGGCGFLGSNVCEYYINKGAKVISYDNMTKHELLKTGFAVDKARNYNYEYQQKLGVKTVIGDVRNLEELLDNAQGCDYIIHTAAQPAMTISWEDPALDFTTNALGTFNVLEAARRLKIPVACCATVHVYGNEINLSLKEGEKRYLREPEAIDETYPTLEGVITPLHASKASGDIYVKAYIDTYGLEAASFRLTGIYGEKQFGGEDHGWVANFAIRTVLGWPITIFGAGKQVRDILYVSDVCAAFDAFYKTRSSGIYNIGGGTQTAISLLDCIDILEDINGKRPEVNFAPDRHGDLRYFICDISKANKELGWKPAVMPHEGIRNLMNWIKENKSVFQS